MHSIEKAIEDFQAKRRAVYKGDERQIERDVNAAERATKDHIGRWFYELLQNCDDACAEEVLVLVTLDTIYIGDNGKGLVPTAVESICGTDLSDKTEGSIGRKGIGFKSVYVITKNPQVFTLSDEGIEFSHEKTTEWLTLYGFKTDKVPHQWVPFFTSRSAAEAVDPNLSELTDYSTVVKLPLTDKGVLEEINKQLNWPAHSLLPFHHVRKLKVRGHAAEEPMLTLSIMPEDDGAAVEDSRLGPDPVHWRVARPHGRPPEDPLSELSPDERRRIEIDGISFMVAAPLDDCRVIPTEDYFPVYVFYPTLEIGPVRLLLHAEFLVKSDRTALIPIEGSKFNQWVADQLARHICDFVQNAYIENEPSLNIALLLPFKDIGTHTVAREIWERIVAAARKLLQLGNVDGHPSLSVAEAWLISVSVGSALARQLMEGTALRSTLLHNTFDENVEARKALKDLGCDVIRDADVIGTIKQFSANCEDHNWTWTCWEWLAEWVASEPDSTGRRERLESVKNLQIIPVQGRSCSAADLEGHFVTWRDNEQEQRFPKWLPLTFVDDWFRDRIQQVLSEAKAMEPPEEPPIAQLLKELEIRKPGDNILQRALGLAIMEYWQSPRAPERFLDYLLEQNWHETSEPVKTLLRCPVPAVRESSDEPTWVEAQTAYFGEAWDNHILRKLYKGNADVLWALPINDTHMSQEKLREVLNWLGVASFPRLIKNAELHVNETGRVRREIAKCTSLDKIPSPLMLEHIDIPSLELDRSALLLRLLARHWEGDYGHESVFRARYKYHRWQLHSTSYAWWNAITNHLSVKLRSQDTLKGLRNCWLPDKQTDSAIGELLPVIDLNIFKEDREIVEFWLTNSVRLRRNTAELALEEWKDMLFELIPERIPVVNHIVKARLRDKIAGWYRTCLVALAERDDVPAKSLADGRLLCQKGDVWNYINDESRYLADADDLNNAFVEDFWLLHIPASLRGAAEKYFDVPALSKSVQEEIIPGSPRRPIEEELRVRLEETLEYIYVLRSVESNQDAKALRTRLKSLRAEVVPDLKADLTLDGVSHTIDRSYTVRKDNFLLVHENNVNEVVLGQALAEAIGVKSQADTYENLLRCNGNDQRKEKLLAKGITGAEVDRLLREYSEIPIEIDVPPVKPAQGEQTVLKGKGKDKPGPQVKPPSKGKNAGRKPEAPSLQLKRAGASHYVVRSEPTASPGGGGGGGAGGVRSPNEGRVLSQQERREIEECGRAFAQLELEKISYTVEQKPFENPGFDILAKRGGEELHVEVKAHLGRATIVDIGTRQYQAFVRSSSKEDGRYRWELWNIEHLSENENKGVVITKYTTIPDEALDVRTFRVDLKKCS